VSLTLLKSFLDGIEWAMLPIVLVALAFDLFMTFKYRDFTPYYWLIVTPIYAIRAMICITIGRGAVIEVLLMIWGILIIHLWWKKRPPKNRKKSEASSRVKILAGKLVVVPARG
jgi:hypothetical protein